LPLDRRSEDAMSADPRGQLAQLPAVDALVRDERLSDLVATHGARVVVDAARTVVEEARAEALEGRPLATTEDLCERVNRRFVIRDRRRVRRVINATGVVLHTNLGRAPLSAEARHAVAEAAGYATVEYDLETGGRGSRTHHLGELAAELCGTPAATVVNNGAAALVLVLAALAHDREVVVSRGELVEIGGSYRLPEVMTAAGSRLVEVGTTNRTRIADYRAAVSERTGLLLKVHRSNFRIVGFTEEATLAELVALGRERDRPVVHDLGTGALRPARTGPLAGEPSVEDAVRAGVDLVVVSADKLLGGPQAGVIAGDAALVERCRRHPLARAVRVDKLQRAALEATFAAHRRDPVPVDVPTVAMLHADTDELHERAARMAAELGPAARVVATTGLVGGGALPGTELPGWGVALDVADPDALAAGLRDVDPPVIGRVDEGALVLDLRTVPPPQDTELVDLVLLARG
jgi:L-seryl-tRNA(Ser) seleniumtransferase